MFTVPVAKGNIKVILSAELFDGKFTNTAQGYKIVKHVKNSVTNIIAEAMHHLHSVSITVP